MAALVFDNGVNQGGTGDNNWDDDTNWFAGTKPADNDDVQISADCHVSGDYSGFIMETLLIDVGDTLTVQNGADIRFDTDAGTINGTLVVQTGGAVQLSDVTWTVTVTTGTITMDGGTINLVRVGATTILLVNGTITTTANGGTINNNANANDGAYVQLGISASVSGFSAAVRLAINTTGGANKTHGLRLSGTGARVKWVNVLGKADSYAFYITARQGCEISGCIARGADGANLLAAGYYGSLTRHFLRDSYAYWCVSGMTMLGGQFFVTNCTFGQTEVGGAAANTQDMLLSNYAAYIVHRNCLFASPTELATVSASGEIVSTAHDNDKNNWKWWRTHRSSGVWHLIAGEGTVLHTGGGKAISFATASDTTSAENLRLRFPVALWPATHGDTIDVTLWVRTTNNTNKVKVIVDPDGTYGTPQEIEVTSAAADTYELVTVPQYTVNTSAGVKSVIPIVVQIEEASKTWYADDLTINGQAQTLDYGAYDGVLPLENIGGAAGGSVLGPFDEPWR